MIMLCFIIKLIWRLIEKGIKKYHNITFMYDEKIIFVMTIVFYFFMKSSTLRQTQIEEFVLNITLTYSSFWAFLLAIYLINYSMKLIIELDSFQHWNFSSISLLYELQPVTPTNNVKT